MDSSITSLTFFEQPGYKIVSFEKLSGGQQNHNYKITVENGEKFVCRVPGIDAHEHGQAHQIVFNNSVIAHKKLKIAPRPCYFDEKTGIILTEYIEGDTVTMSALRENDYTLDKVINAIRSFHKETDSSSTFTSSKASDVLFGYDLSLLEEGSDENVIEKTKQLQSLLNQSVGKFDSKVNCHNDLAPANFLDSSDGHIYIIDWEWSGPGDRFCDLASFVAISEMNPEEEERVLNVYLRPCKPTDTDRSRLYLWRMWLTLRGGLWALSKARSPHFSNRNPAEITEDDDYERFARDGIEEFETKLNDPITENHITYLKRNIKEK